MGVFFYLACLPPLIPQEVLECIPMDSPWTVEDKTDEKKHGRSTQEGPTLGFEPRTILRIAPPHHPLVWFIVLWVEDIYFTSSNESNNPSLCPPRPLPLPFILQPHSKILSSSSWDRTQIIRIHYPDQYALSPKNWGQASCEEVPASAGRPMLICRLAPPISCGEEVCWRASTRGPGCRQH